MQEEAIMLIKTRYFGEINLGEEKIITFENGLIGFEGYTTYTLLYDNDKEEETDIMWLQSTEEQSLAFPVINPFHVKSDYNPSIEEELLAPLGELNDDNTCVLLTVTVPSDIQQTAVNLKAPLIINSDTRKGCQIIADNKEYSVKYNLYEAIQRAKKEKGEK